MTAKKPDVEPIADDDAPEDTPPPKKAKQEPAPEPREAPPPKKSFLDNLDASIWRTDW